MDMSWGLDSLASCLKKMQRRDNPFGMRAPVEKKGWGVGSEQR